MAGGVLFVVQVGCGGVGSLGVRRLAWRGVPWQAWFGEICRIMRIVHICPVFERKSDFLCI